MMVVGVDEARIKNESADNGGTEESGGKHKNQTGTGVGAEDNNALMLLLWATGARVLDDGIPHNNQPHIFWKR